MERTLRRLTGALFALSLCGGAARASAEPIAPRVKGTHDARAKTSLRESGEFELVDPARPDNVYRTLLDVADGNRDHSVSRDELEGFVQARVRAQVSRRFTRIDRDRDGRVTRAEVPRMDAARFARFDRNGDAAFSLVELAEVMRLQAGRYCERLIARLDADRDGALGVSELTGSSDQRVAELQVPAKAAPGSE